MMENDPEYIENDKEHHDHGDGGQLRTFQLPSNQSFASSDPVLFSDNVDLSSFMDDIIVMIEVNSCFNTNELEDSVDRLESDQPFLIVSQKPPCVHLLQRRGFMKHHDHGDGGQLRTFQLPSNQSFASSDPVLFSDNVDLSSFMDDIIVMIEVNSCFNTNELEDSVDRLESDQPFLIVSQKPPCVHLLQRRGFMSYFWLQPADKFVGFQFPLSEGVIEIDTTEDLIKELYHELAQYYRKEALRVRKQEAGAVKAKDLLAKSTQCYKILEKGSAKALEQYKALLMQSNTNINKAMGTSSELS
ncbi:unnamed protein product [Rotaria socialis]